MSSEVRNDTVTQPKILFLLIVWVQVEQELAEKLPRLRCLGVVRVVVSLRHCEKGVQAELQGQGFDVRILSAKGLIGRVTALREIVRKEQPDAIQTFLFHSDIAGRLSAFGTQIQVISHVVSTDYDEIRFHEPNTKAIRLRRPRVIDGWTAQHLSQHILACSNTVKAGVMRDLVIPCEKITVIKHGRDSMPQCATSKTAQWKPPRATGWPSSMPTLSPQRS